MEIKQSLEGRNENRLKIVPSSRRLGNSVFSRSPVEPKSCFTVHESNKGRQVLLRLVKFHKLSQFRMNIYDTDLCVDPDHVNDFAIIINSD